MSTESADFSKMILGFYTTFVDSLAESVDRLADVQEKFPDKYKVMVEVEEDPGRIAEFTEELTDEEKSTMLTTIIRLSALARRAAKVFDLSVDEKRALSEELRKFSKEINLSKSTIK